MVIKTIMESSIMQVFHLCIHCKYAWKINSIKFVACVHVSEFINKNNRESDSILYWRQFAKTGFLWPQDQIKWKSLSELKKKKKMILLCKMCCKLIIIESDNIYCLWLCLFLKNVFVLYIQRVSKIHLQTFGAGSRHQNKVKYDIGWLGCFQSENAIWYRHASITICVAACKNHICLLMTWITCHC